MLDFLTQSETVAAIFTWMDENSYIVTASLIFSVVLFIASPFIIAWIAVRMPKDYFVGEERSDKVSSKLNPVLYYTFRVVKNLIGVVLVLAGIAMLVLPGQGILTILIGVSLIHFPGKYKVERWLVSRPAVFNSINWIRRKAEVPELISPDGVPEPAAE